MAVNHQHCMMHKLQGVNCSRGLHLCSGNTNMPAEVNGDALIEVLSHCTLIRAVDSFDRITTAAQESRTHNHTSEVHELQECCHEKRLMALCIRHLSLTATLTAFTLSKAMLAIHKQHRIFNGQNWYSCCDWLRLFTMQKYRNSNSQSIGSEQFFTFSVSVYSLACQRSAG